MPFYRAVEGLQQEMPKSALSGEIDERNTAELPE